MPGTPRRLTFGANAAAYERARPDWPLEAARWLVPGEPGLVVELGAGTGKLTRSLAALGLHVVAVEPDARMLTVLRGHGLEGVEGSAESIPVEDGAAGAVVAGSSFHWFEHETALPEIQRVLRPGGRFAFAWNHRDAREPALARMSDAVRAARGAPEGWRRHDWPALVVASGLFAEVEHAQFRHVLELSSELLDDHLLSYSGIARLPDAEREALAAQVRELVEPVGGGADVLRLPFLVDAYRCVRT